MDPDAVVFDLEGDNDIDLGDFAKLQNKFASVP